MGSRSLLKAFVFVNVRSRLRTTPVPRGSTELSPEFSRARSSIWVGVENGVIAGSFSTETASQHGAGLCEPIRGGQAPHLGIPFQVTELSQRGRQGAGDPPSPSGPRASRSRRWALLPGEQDFHLEPLKLRFSQRKW